MIIQDLKDKIKEYMKVRKTEELGLLRLVLGTAQQEGDESDKALEAIFRKFIKNNLQTIRGLKKDGVTHSVGIQEPLEVFLLEENKLLKSFLPKTMSVKDIVDFINDNSIDVCSQTHAGSAVGGVMKMLKAEGKTVQGGDVKTAVESLR